MCLGKIFYAMSDDDEQPDRGQGVFVPRNVISYMTDLLAQDPSLQEQAAQMVKTARALFLVWPRPMPVPDHLAQILHSMSVALREVGRMIPNDLVVFAPAAMAQGTAPSPSTRTSFTASGSIGLRKPSIFGEGTAEEPKDDLVTKQSVGIGRLVAIALCSSPRRGCSA